MSSKNRTSLVADSTLDYIETSFGTSETPLWDAGQFTPLKATGRLPRSWRLVAAGVTFTGGGGDVTLKLYNGPADSGGSLMGSVTVPNADVSGGKWYLQAEINARLVPGSTIPPYMIEALGFIVAPNGAVIPISPSKANYDPGLDTILSASAISTSAGGSIWVASVTLEALN